MTGSDDADLTALEQATAGLVEAVAGIEEDERVLPTPCSEWNLADLVDHVTGGNWYTVLVLAGESSDDALSATMARFGGGPASSSDAVQSAADQLDAFRTADALDRPWDHVAGAIPGRQILRLRLHDLIVHTWDVSETRQPPASIPEALAAWGLDELREADSLLASHFPILATPDTPEPTDDAAGAYLSAFGRRGGGESAGHRAKQRY